MTNWKSIPAKAVVGVLTLALANGGVTRLRADHGNKGTTNAAKTSSSGKGSATVQKSGGTSGGTRLKAKGIPLLNGVMAELEGEFRTSGTRTRLKASLENFPADAATVVSFCLNATTPIGAGAVEQEIQNEAEAELDSQNGDAVPAVVAGDTIDAFAGGAVGAPVCGGTSLGTATFKQKN
jgi:hypothetical protein